MPTFTWDQIQPHNTIDSCWIVFNNHIFDVTSYIKSHPGGRWIMLQNAGKDATEALNKTTHSPVAEEIMWELYIGDVQDN